MQTETKEITIKLDGNSIDVLKQVDSMYRESIINIGIRMISLTPYYKFLSGKDDVADINALTSLDTNCNTNALLASEKSQEVVNEAPSKLKRKTKSSWDDL